MSDFLPCFFVGGNDSLDSDLGLTHRSLIISDQQYVLFVIIIRLWNCTGLLRTLAPDQNFAPSFLLQSLLVKPLRSNDHPYIVDAVVLRNVDLPFKLIRFMNGFKCLVLLRVCVVIAYLSC